MIIIKKNKFGFHNFAKHLQKSRGTPVKNQCFKHSNLIGHFLLYRGTKGTIILLNIFIFYILKYFIKFLQNHDNNKKKQIQLL